MPDDFVVFSKSRKSVFRYKKKTNRSWDVLIRREWMWEFYDNVGSDSVKEALEDPEHEVFLGYI